MSVNNEILDPIDSESPTDSSCVCLLTNTYREKLKALKEESITYIQDLKAVLSNKKTLSNKELDAKRKELKEKKKRLEMLFDHKSQEIQMETKEQVSLIRSQHEKHINDNAELLQREKNKILKELREHCDSVIRNYASLIDDSFSSSTSNQTNNDISPFIISSKTEQKEPTKTDIPETILTVSSVVVDEQTDIPTVTLDIRKNTEKFIETVTNTPSVTDDSTVDEEEDEDDISVVDIIEHIQNEKSVPKKLLHMQPEEKEKYIQKQLKKIGVTDRLIKSKSKKMKS